jgi:hypothetical protein
MGLLALFAAVESILTLISRLAHFVSNLFFRG